MDNNILSPRIINFIRNQPKTSSILHKNNIQTIPTIPTIPNNNYDNNYDNDYKDILKYHNYNNISDLIYFVTDINCNILYGSNCFYNLLNISKISRKKLSIFCFMPYEIALAHKTYLLMFKSYFLKKQVNTIYKLQFNKCNNLPVTIFNSEGTQIRCKIKVLVNKEINKFVCIIKVINNKDYVKIEQCYPEKYLPSIMKGSLCDIDFNVDLYNDIIILFIDIANSTEFTQNHTPTEIALLYHETFGKITQIIYHYYFPFAYVHETIGDAVLILINAPWKSHCKSDTPTRLSIRLALEIQLLLDRILYNRKNMYVRIGIATGTIAAGVVDAAAFRIWGNTVNYAQRLESNCPQNYILISERIYNNLLNEHKNNEFPKFNIEEISNIHLKGIKNNDKIYKIHKNEIIRVNKLIDNIDNYNVIRF